MYYIFMAITRTFQTSRINLMDDRRFFLFVYLQKVGFWRKIEDYSNAQTKHSMKLEAKDQVILYM